MTLKQWKRYTWDDLQPKQKNRPEVGRFRFIRCNLFAMFFSYLLVVLFTHGPPSTRAVHPTENGSFTGSHPVWPTIVEFPHYRLSTGECCLWALLVGFPFQENKDNGARNNNETNGNK